MKMDVKTVDILEIDSLAESISIQCDFNPELLSFDLANLTLGNNSNIFEEPENTSNDVFEDPKEISKYKDNRDNKIFLSLAPDTKINKNDNTTSNKELENFTSETSITDKLSNNVENEEDSLNISEKKIDINGNEDPLADENFNNLLLSLTLSDSDNEAEDESSESQHKEENKDSSLRERGPVSRKRSKNQKQIPYSRREYDKEQFDPQTLRFLSGSNCVQGIDTKEINNYNVQNNSALITEGINCLIPELGTNDQFYNPVTTSLSVNILSQNKIIIPDNGITNLYEEDYGAKCVSSPESGYGTSTLGSPPQSELFERISDPVFFTENVNEEDVIEQVADMQSSSTCASPAFNLASEEEILEFLMAKDCGIKSGDIISNENKEFELSNTIASDTNRNCMTINNTDSSYISPITPVTVMYDSTCASPAFNLLGYEEDTFQYSKPRENDYRIKSCDVISKENKEFELSNKKPSDTSRNCKTIINNTDLNYVPPVTSVSVVCEISQSGGIPIAFTPPKDEAKNNFHAILSKDKIRAIMEEIYKNINKQLDDKSKKKDDVKVIYIEDEVDKTSENRTNLHNAILNKRLEEVYCLVEIHKQYKKPFSHLSPRDKNGKTPLDYALRNNMILVAEYLMENFGCRGVKM